MKVLLQGQRHRPAAALEVGLVDELAATPEELLDRARAWIAANPDAAQPWDRPGYRMPGGTPSQPDAGRDAAGVPGQPAQAAQGRAVPGARATSCAAAVEGAQVDVDTAFAHRGPLLRRRWSPGRSSKNMIKAFFFDLQHINGGGSRPDGLPSVAADARSRVLGAGMMGAGIAYVCARAGLDVVLKDVSLEAAERGKGYSERLLDKARRARPDDRREAATRCWPGSRPTADVADLAGCDLVIEAVFEDPDAQARGVRRGARSVVAPDALLCLEHLDAADHRAGRGRGPAEPTSSACTSSRRWTRCRWWRSSAASRPRDAALARAFDVALAITQDADRGQRQPRLLHQPGDRHVHQRGHRDARRGHRPADRSSRRRAGRLPGPGAAADGRADADPAAQDPRGDPGGGRGGRRHVAGRTRRTRWSTG